MSIKATILAGALGLPLLAGTAFAAETRTATLIDAAKAGDHAAVRTLLNGPAKSYVAGPQGTAALIWAAEHNDVQTVDLLLAAGSSPATTIAELLQRVFAFWFISAAFSADTVRSSLPVLSPSCDTGGTLALSSMVSRRLVIGVRLA